MTNCHWAVRAAPPAAAVSIPMPKFEAMIRSALASRKSRVRETRRVRAGVFEPGLVFYGNKGGETAVQAVYARLLRGLDVYRLVNAVDPEWPRCGGVYRPLAGYCGDEMVAVVMPYGVKS